MDDKPSPDFALALSLIIVLGAIHKKWGYYMMRANIPIFLNPKKNQNKHTNISDPELWAKKSKIQSINYTNDQQDH